MVTLLSLTHFSLISVLAYLCLITLVFTISFRIYKNVMQAVQKTSDGHPFKAWLEVDISLSEEKVREMSEVAVARINRFVTELRRLFLVEDLIDSIKFAVALWALTNVGAWFNGLTLVIIGVVAMFTMPKVYENNKAQFDAYISLASAKLSEITNK
ncbi:hypothetical protein AAG570_003423 [Ranatra chinensis]|uniref:Reticulon-like protein n=1 Tax=Ranatra chinensis TaxID=642074 RepID=A0ABD0YI34_9HEMI